MQIALVGVERGQMVDDANWSTTFTSRGWNVSSLLHEEDLLAAGHVTHFPSTNRGYIDNHSLSPHSGLRLVSQMPPRRAVTTATQPSCARREQPCILRLL